MSRYPKRERGPSLQEKRLRRSYEEGVMLAHTYSKEKPSPPNPAGWWMSEKLDGVRAYYNGEHLFTRNGNKIPAPDFFREGLPRGGVHTHLDGEIFLGRGKFEACAGIARSTDPSRAEEWRRLRFLVFDAPVVDGRIDVPYEDRVEHSRKAVSDAPFAEVVDVSRCRGEAHLEEALAEVLSKGGEGLMLREGGSLYARARSHSLLKVKSFLDDEARVIGHSPDKKIEGAMGSLICEMPLTGVQFKVGSGIAMSDRIDFERAKGIWPVGTVISYGYQGLTVANGRPRFPTYIRCRDDKSWEEVIADAARSGDANSDTSSSRGRSPLATDVKEGEEREAVAKAPPKKRAKNAAAQRKRQICSTEKGGNGPKQKNPTADAGEGCPPSFATRGVCETESGEKFWEAQVYGSAMTVTFGKVGAKGQSKTTDFGDARTATREAKKAKSQKAKKGYVF